MKLSWKECVEQKIITKQLIDYERIKNLLNMAEIRFEFWKNQSNCQHVSLIIEGYYEVIKELILILIHKEGFNCSNHLCLISFLEEFYSSSFYEISKIDELRRLRNDINYRGFYLKPEYLVQNKETIKKIINFLFIQIKKIY
ncbi:MAG: hypothetical protein AB7V77_05525 [Candidatus Woesearchaeota archaeon]